MDPVLNERAYIMPGLGDAGDRINGVDADEHPRDMLQARRRLRHEYHRPVPIPAEDHRRDSPAPLNGAGTGQSIMSERHRFFAVLRRRYHHSARSAIRRELPCFRRFFAPRARKIGGRAAFAGIPFGIIPFRRKNLLLRPKSAKATWGRIWPGHLRLPVRQFIGSASRAAADFVLRARAYAHWSFVSRFCSFCGETALRGARPRFRRRARVRRLRPRLFPAHFPGRSSSSSTRAGKSCSPTTQSSPPGRHGLIAGFVEPGETLEETVHREVMEEAGIRILEPPLLHPVPALAFSRFPHDRLRSRIRSLAKPGPMARKSIISVGLAP